MSEGTVSGRSVDEAPTERGQARGEEGAQGTPWKLAPYARWGIRSGAVAGILGGIVTLRGLQAVRRGDWRGGVVRIFFGGLLTAAAAGQRRRTSDQSSAATAGRPEAGAPDSSQETDAIEAEPEGGGTGTESQESARQESERTEIEGYRRMGAAAFDRESGRVPAPQHAFDMEYLVLNGEVYWGIRETDGVVVVSQRYDPMEDREDERYVASSQVDDERKVKIPDTILDHWDEEVGGGIAVESGDDVVFARAGELEEDNQLAVVPEEWSDDVFDEEG